MKNALRGVNLGGWLVAERWMTPSLFKGVGEEGEIALVRELGSQEAKRRLQEHRRKFITEKDFSWIKQQGYDFVRLPVGYWLFQKTDDFIDGEGYVKKAFTWAKKHRLGVVLDFHGLPGSQNGLDHSGQIGRVRMYRAGNYRQSLETLTYLCKTYGSEPALIGFEVINEPKLRYCARRLMKYYDQAITVCERYLRPEVKVIVSDAFQPLRLARMLSKKKYSHRIVLDIHLYQVFSRSDANQSFHEHVVRVGGQWAQLLEECNRYVEVMVGEWSAALPPEAYELSGQSEDELARQYFEAQQNLFDVRSWAHAYWSYKASSCGVWNLAGRPDFW